MKTLLQRFHALAEAAETQADTTAALLASGKNAQGEPMTAEQEAIANRIVSYNRGMARAYKDAMVYVARDIEDFNAAAISHAFRTTETEARLRKALSNLYARDVRNTCQHEDTYRGGLLWEICRDCGAKWADDEGGKPEWVDPPEWNEAISALSVELVKGDANVE